MRCTPISAAFVLLLSGLLPAEEPEPVELVIHARAIETPVLKYRLLPSEMELKPGNAVPILLRLPWEQTPWMTKVYPTLSEWESLPLSAPEWESLGGVLPESFYNEMKRAAFRREASWEYPIQETQSPYLILLPDVQGLRGFLGMGLSARIRYHLSRGELDKAREGILVGLANGRHLARTPFYINQVVVLAIHRTMLERTDELISQPKSPNLYWALSTLPDSLLELDRAASLEGSGFAMTFPAVNELDRPRDAKEWSKMASQLIELLQLLGEIPKQEQPKGDASVVEQFVQRLHPAGKTHLTSLIKRARAELPELLRTSEENVAAMSDDEAGVRWYVHIRLARDQHAAAVLSLSPREAWPQLKQVQEEFRSLREMTGAKGYDFLDPVSIYVSAWSLKRKIQALRIIEAVRHHLATHDGKLPETLDDIKDVSIPLDPLTDQPFQWEVDGKTATLRAPHLPVDVIAPGSATDRASFWEYRLQVK
ncbi:MAG: hypothetical protein EXS05_20835 [Planctomycetaceae bacterium]|nr:hypothetical protein [Planctomycetaceae bacterium]